MQSYYGIAGIKSYGVYTDYDMAKRQVHYCKMFHIEEFPSREEAEEWVEKKQKELSSQYVPVIEEIKHLNRTYHCKDVKVRRPIVYYGK